MWFAGVVRTRHVDKRGNIEVENMSLDAKAFNMLFRGVTGHAESSGESQIEVRMKIHSSFTDRFLEKREINQKFLGSFQ